MNADTNKLPHFGRIIDGTNMVSETVSEAEILQKKLKLNRSYQCKFVLEKKQTHGQFKEEHR